VSAACLLPLGKLTRCVAAQRGQVSSVRIPFFVTDDCSYNDEDSLIDPNVKPRQGVPYFSRRCRVSDHLKASGFGTKEYQLPVKTLRTIMRELDHSAIAIMKLDVEGSEFAFLESALDDFDCPPVDQMSIEWHHFSFDMRYGGGSSPEINAIAMYLHDRCNVKQYQVDYPHGGFVDNLKWITDSKLLMRYNTGSYMRVPTHPPQRRRSPTK